ncbi:uncharacterized protein LOC123715121 [Pieris brassicae]|uniref:DNA/RNA non-specific endonuclease/pyrophosphatase/phosphodiesterase domain-containing protein n=1 Tax=Pieris brassicae TaxID=7116 RepID=A0A9P0TQB1_PIEBR|nr:uncharacterized protein LOC123715121 [Pieris brassicae]CAH4033352.1 unnamed protein product [Pieris brassicae]
MKFVLLVTLFAAVSSIPTELPYPDELVYKLGEEEFEDYVDKWIEFQQRKWTNTSEATTTSARSGCTLNVRNDFSSPQPVFIHRWLNNYLAPHGNSGQVRLNSGDEIIVACTGSGRQIRHPNIISNVAVATARCVNNNLVSGAGWLNGNRAFRQLTCSGHAISEAVETNERCYGNNVVIRVGYVVNNVLYPTYWSCYDKRRFEVLYVWYAQNPSNSVPQTGVDRPSWMAGNFFPGVNINNLYTRNRQREAIARSVGNNMVDRYVTNHQFLSRGHLVAKSDQVFATGQRATFYFVNAGPQWQPFNGGNWNSLELNLRDRIARAGYHTTIYTGTFGVTQLRNSAGHYVDLFLDNTGNNRRVPVPQYFYKVAYDANRRIGTAFIGINNPYYSLAEARALQFCTDRCRNNNAFSWLRWQPDRVDLGYSFCCTIADFRRRVPHLPAFTVNGLLS